MSTYTLTMDDGQTHTLTVAASSPWEGEDVSRAVTDTLGLGYWIDRITPISWNVRDSRYNTVCGTIERDHAAHYPIAHNDWECVARINGDTLTLSFFMLPNRGYWEAPSAAYTRTLAREAARRFGRELAYRAPVERNNVSRGFHARYTLAD